MSCPGFTWTALARSTVQFLAAQCVSGFSLVAFPSVEICESGCQSGSATSLFTSFMQTRARFSCYLPHGLMCMPTGCWRTALAAPPRPTAPVLFLQMQQCLSALAYHSPQLFQERPSLHCKEAEACKATIHQLRLTRPQLQELKRLQPVLQLASPLVTQDCLRGQYHRPVLLHKS